MVKLPHFVHALKASFSLICTASRECLNATKVKTTKTKEKQYY